MVPAGTPAPAVARLREALANPPVVQRMAAAGPDAAGSTPAELEAFIAREFERGGALIREKNIRVEG